jgi:two-component system, OmpR family, copper resistance phosphate regulon response regulator CusR
MKILIIEDEHKSAQALQAFLEEETQAKVDCAFDGYTGKRFAQQNEYDIIICDVVMPNINGIELCMQLRQLKIPTPILIVSALHQPEDKIAGLNAGADDYLAKPFNFHELLARIQALIRRNKQIFEPQKNLTFADVKMNLITLEVWRNNTKVILTPREFALLEYFIRNKGRVIPKAELLDRVWGIDEEVNTNVIEVYVNYIRNKIDKNFEPKLIHTHFGVGYILKVEE